MKAMEFGDVLKSVCQKLTDNQYHYFLRRLRLHLTPNIHWKYFLENFSSFLDEVRHPPSKELTGTANSNVIIRASQMKICDKLCGMLEGKLYPLLCGEGFSCVREAWELACSHLLSLAGFSIQRTLDLGRRPGI